MKKTIGGLAVLSIFLVASYAQAASFTLHMNGQKEPNGAGQLGVGDPDGVGTAHLDIDPVLDMITFSIDYANLNGTSVSGLHIHGPDATPTTNKSVYVGFPVSSQSLPNGNQSGMVMVANLADLGTRIDAILANPTGFYLNLHTGGTGGFPSGAIRAQLPEPATLSALALGTMFLARRRRRA